MEPILTECQGNGSSSIHTYFPPYSTSSRSHSSVPIIVIFTKLDILRETCEKKLEEDLERQDEEMDDDTFEAKIETVVDKAVQTLCVEPLHALIPSDCPYPWIATSSGYALQLSKLKF